MFSPKGGFEVLVKFLFFLILALSMYGEIKMGYRGFLWYIINFKKGFCPEWHSSAQIYHFFVSV